jgi:hypothetical protein
MVVVCDPHNPNNCLGLAMANFVCSTHKKSVCVTAPSAAAVSIVRDRGVKNMRRIGTIAVAATGRLDGSSRVADRVAGEASVLDSMRRDPVPWS